MPDAMQNQKTKREEHEPKPEPECRIRTMLRAAMHRPDIIIDRQKSKKVMIC